MEQLILVRFGEIHLKGLNRPYFEHRLVREMKRRLYDDRRPPWKREMGGITSGAYRTWMR